MLAQDIQNFEMLGVDADNTPRRTFTSQIFYPINLPLDRLPIGTNVVAVEIHQSSVTNSVLGFDMELTLVGYLLPRPSLSIAPGEGNMLLSWPVTNGSTFSLYSTLAMQATATWSRATGVAYTNGGQIVVTQSPDTSAAFFRLQQP